MWPRVLSLVLDLAVVETASVGVGYHAASVAAAALRLAGLAVRAATSAACGEIPGGTAALVVVAPQVEEVATAARRSLCGGGQQHLADWANGGKGSTGGTGQLSRTGK